MVSTRLPIFAASYRLGSVGGGNANPVTFAPRRVNHNDIQPPLKPVCPVTSTRFPFQND